MKIVAAILKMRRIWFGLALVARLSSSPVTLHPLQPHGKVASMNEYKLSNKPKPKTLGNKNNRQQIKFMPCCSYSYRFLPFAFLIFCRPPPDLFCFVLFYSFTFGFFLFAIFISACFCCSPKQMLPETDFHYTHICHTTSPQSPASG